MYLELQNVSKLLDNWDLKVMLLSSLIYGLIMTSNVRGCPPMQVLVRLVGADDHIYAFHVESLQWLADTDLLEMLVDKLSPPVHTFFFS